MMVDNNPISERVQMQLEFAGIPRLQVLAERVTVLYGVDVLLTGDTNISAERLETIKDYYALAAWLMSRYNSPRGLKLEVFG